MWRHVWYISTNVPEKIAVTMLPLKMEAERSFENLVPVLDYVILLFYTEDGCARLFGKVVTHVPNYTVSHYTLLP
jgi:hypothetical protein